MAESFRPSHLLMWFGSWLLAGVLIGCGDVARGPYQSTGEAERDTIKADALYRETLPILDSDKAEAEQKLRQVLGFDLYHGAAHNNLGVLLLEQGKLYDAAEEFEWARKLLPGNPEPRTNLAIVLTRAGKHHDAIGAAKGALEVQPGNLHAMQTLAYVQIRENLVEKQTKQLLESIILRSDEPIWQEWAKRSATELLEYESCQERD